MKSRLLCLLFLAALVITPLPQRALAAPSVGVHFEGTFYSGQRPAPAGTPLTVIVARSVDDVTVCGTGSVSGSNGQYRVDVQAAPPCVNSATSRNNGPYIFISNGENVGGCSCLPNEESPSTLGRTMHVDAHGTPISLSAAASTLPAVRLWGSLSLAGRPAPTGIRITATASKSHAECGQGAVIDNSGTYWLDVRANTDCANSRASGNPGPYILLVNGENVGGCACAPSLDNPASLGQTVVVNLRGDLVPAPLLQGSVSTTPQEQTGAADLGPAALAASADMGACLKGAQTACGTAATEATACAADQTLTAAARTFCAGVLETLGTLGGAACTAPMLLVTISCQPAGEPPTQPAPSQSGDPQPQPAQPRPVPLPVDVEPEDPTRCRYRGGELVYVPGTPAVGIDHILAGHARNAVVRERRQFPQGIFFGDLWPEIQPEVDAANADPTTALAWIPQGGQCVLNYRFSYNIGYDDPPWAPVRPAMATGQPTNGLRIVIINQPSPAVVITAFPIQ